MSQPTAPYRILAIALVAIFSACAPRAANRGSPRAEAATLLEVRNDRWDDLTVYLERGGTLLKLGMVPGLSTRVLRVPAAYLPYGGSVRLKAMRPGFGVQAASVPFSLAQGQHAVWVAARTSGPTGVAVR